MMEELKPEEVKTLIKASRLAREKGIKQGASIKEICKAGGISRKTGYQWLKDEEASIKKKEVELQKLIHLKVDHQKLLRRIPNFVLRMKVFTLLWKSMAWMKSLKKSSL
ncbi:hypothetical protein [Desulfobacula sp.]